MTLSVKMAIYNGILARYPCFFSFTLFISICLFSAKVTYAFLADKKLQRNSLFKSENLPFTFINRLRFQWYRSGSICSAFSILQCSIYSTFSILQCSITLYFLYSKEAFPLHFLYHCHLCMEDHLKLRLQFLQIHRLINLKVYKFSNRNYDILNNN